MSEESRLAGFEETLRARFEAMEPEAAFLARLEKDLRGRADVLPASVSPLRQHPWRFALVAVFLALAAAVLAIGPDRVWAQLLRWTGYLPGVGVVELNGTRALSAPVSQARGGVRLSLEQFVATPDESIVIARITGGGVPVSSLTRLRVEWAGGSLRGRSWMVDPEYGDCAPACASAEPIAYVLRAVYEPLPPEVSKVRVTWTFPGSLRGTSVDWPFDLELQPIEDMPSRGWTVWSYGPPDARDLHHGIELAVTRVFQDAQTTIVEMQIEVPEGVSAPSMHGVFLASDQGRTYSPAWSNDLDTNPVPVVTTTPVSTAAATRTLWPGRLLFTPGDPAARELTLQADGILVGYESEFEFSVMMPETPTAGQAIPLDVRFEADGFQVHVDQVRIVEAQRIEPPHEPTPTLALEFHIDSPVEQNGRQLKEIWLDPLYNQAHADFVVDPKTGILTERLAWDPVFTPLEPMTVRLDRVVLDIEGPWVVSWPVPGSSPGTR